MIPVTQTKLLTWNEGNSEMMNLERLTVTEANGKGRRGYLGNAAEIDAQEKRCRDAGMVIVSRVRETV